MPVAKPGWVEVLVDCPGAQGLYTYGVPEDLAVQPGDVLSVPFGSQQVGAIAIQLRSVLPADLDTGQIRCVEEVISPGFFPATYWTLLQRVADYYCASLMQVVKVALPPGLLGRSQRRIRLKPEALPDGAELFVQATAQQLLSLLQTQKKGDYSWQFLQRQIRGAQRGLKDLIQRGWVESYLEPPAAVRPKQKQAVIRVADSPIVDLSPRQQEILEVLKRRGGEMWLQDLLQTCQVSSSVLKTLAQKGCVVLQAREVLRLEDSPIPASDTPKDLTPAQAEALAAIAPLQQYKTVLLHGVTGSGKTEVYLQAIAPHLQAGRSALVLVPEIGLTPQLTDRFRARFGDRVRVYHSALSEGERYDTWRQMLSGIPQVLIGTRSAVFAPLPNLGLIILDEEHDGSFKQDQPAPCYHARKVAQWRAELADCPLILGSATPSLESWVMVAEAEAATPSHSPNHSTALYLSLPTRVRSRPHPPIQVVDMRQELSQGNRSIFSRSLQSALEDLVEKKQQGILFIHRRGHSTFVSCRSCGHVMECPHCDVSLSYHQTQEGGYQSLRCHYCGFGQSHPDRCPTCDSPYLKHFGSGTQRIMQELSRHLPQLRCLRFDSDTTRAKGAHRNLLTRFAQGEADLLVGTQMLTKGIDLPQVTLVGIVAADGLLHLSDYRASERAFQTLTQVAGRAGRGEEPGQVILQTYTPHHAVIEAVQGQRFQTFIEAELGYRAALQYPPYGKLVVLRLSGINAAAVQQAAEAIAHLLTPPTDAAYELLGPAPAAIARVANRYRWQILLKCPATTALPNLESCRSLCPGGVHLTIDVDPLNLL
ncbi:MAG: primosomal protein N' [Oculatellaceae cyanobacterium Prado106]|nr:primosomal protein N' [Oculatellaceae cyanobacterium Prado106]